MEPTNYFWKLLARELEEQQIPYRLVNAYSVKKHREGNPLDASKDDPRDAKQIAELQPLILALWEQTISGWWFTLNKKGETG